MIAAEPPNPRTLSIVDELLDQQRQMTAVAKFSQLHDRDALPAQAKHFRELIPVRVPRNGEQYAFEVDLDACSGCKACVAACHSLNGLEEHETWRSVGLLHGGTSEHPVIQHVTSACHHCVEPACLHGCPVLAYDKDPVTGIVQHLDDQCIGCKYCMFMCPYDVPRYSSSKGIVRKCDMCHDRLTSGEAPTCVQSCPNRAIRISVVKAEAVIEASQASVFLPGAPDPTQTLPSTNYKTQSALPRNMLPADYYSARPQQSHLPLVVMLVFTQMSIGAFAVEQVLSSLFTWSTESSGTSVRTVHVIAALLLGLLGIAASLFHLGRPQYAFRVWIGLGTSWLSREIIAVGLFAFCASLYAAGALLGESVLLPDLLVASIGVLASLFGVIGILCSVMVYVATRRPFWNGTYTSLKFFGTALILGLPTSLLISLAATSLSSSMNPRAVMDQYGIRICQSLVAVSAVKLLFECFVFTALRDKALKPLKRSAVLLSRELGLTTLKRYFFGLAGGIVLPLVAISEASLSTAERFTPLFVGISVSLSLVCLLIGELLERYLFFTAVAAPKMPGPAVS